MFLVAELWGKALKNRKGAKLIFAPLFYIYRLLELEIDKR